MIVRRWPEEGGSALILSLIFISVWSIVILAIIGFAGTGFKLAAGTADQRDITYAADGTAEAAIMATRDYLVGDGDPNNCPSLHFVSEETVNGTDVIAVDITVDTNCDNISFTQPWEPFEDWAVLSSGPTQWLDNPLLGSQGVLDGEDIVILSDAQVGMYGDADGNTQFDPGEPTEARQLLGDLALTATSCESGGPICQQVLTAQVHFDSESGTPTVATERWRVLR